MSLPENEGHECICDGGGSILHDHDDDKCTGGHIMGCLPFDHEQVKTGDRLELHPEGDRWTE